MSNARREEIRKMEQDYGDVQRSQAQAHAATGKGVNVVYSK